MKKDRSSSPSSADRQAYRIAFLIAGFLQDRLTPDEHRELDNWVTASLDNQRLFEELTDPAKIEEGNAMLRRSRPDQLLQQVKRRLRFTVPRRPVTLQRIWPYLASACLLIVVVVTLLKTEDNGGQRGKMQTESVTYDLPPGSNKATLTLADGTTRRLDSAIQGTLATQGGASVRKDDSDWLAYQMGVSNSMEAPVFNILNVPRGGAFRLLLSDGTRVWLNAESSLKYPAAFTGKEREIELSGEAYFEVAQDASRPFIVRTSNVETLVLGTTFDINTYPEKKTIDITLAQGLVKVRPINSPQKAALLRPGQQAEVDRAGSQVKVAWANVVTTLAWKNGLFVFQNTPLDEVLVQIGRWYNVSTADSTTSANHFNASIPRSVPVSRLLHMLEQTGQVHFRIATGKITATN